MMPKDPSQPELMVRRRNKAHTVYSQRYAAAQPDCETRVLNAD